MIKFNGLFSISLFCMVFSQYSLTAYASMLYGKILSLQQINDKWGAQKFNHGLFKKNEDPVFRAGMAYDLIKSQQYIGVEKSVLLEHLGPQTGYFISEANPAYVIGEERKKVAGEFIGLSWQIVFFLNYYENEPAKVFDVKVYQSCDTHTKQECQTWFSNVLDFLTMIF